MRNCRSWILIGMLGVLAILGLLAMAPPPDAQTQADHQVQMATLETEGGGDQVALRDAQAALAAVQSLVSTLFQEEFEPTLTPGPASTGWRPERAPRDWIANAVPGGGRFSISSI